MSIANLLLSLVLSALAAGPIPQAVPLQELELRRGETALLHRRVELDGLLAFSPAQRGWRPAPRVEAPILVVHLWATECGPCVAELATWREFVNAVQRGSLAKQVRFLFVTETYDDDRLAEFVRKRQSDLPALPILRTPESDRRLRSALQSDQQPITLLVDRKMAVRHAVIGPIEARRGELVTALSRLSELLK